MKKTVVAVRWIARILSALILFFWGYFIVGHLIGSAAQPSRPITAQDGVLFWMMLLWLLGLALAWRWELVGACVTLAAVLIAALINPGAVGGLGMLPPVTALLFLFCWWMSRTSRHTP